MTDVGRRRATRGVVKRCGGSGSTSGGGRRAKTVAKHSVGGGGGGGGGGCTRMTCNSNKIFDEVTQTPVIVPHSSADDGRIYKRKKQRGHVAVDVSERLRLFTVGTRLPISVEQHVLHFCNMLDMAALYFCSSAHKRMIQEALRVSASLALTLTPIDNIIYPDGDLETAFTLLCVFSQHLRYVHLDFVPSDTRLVQLAIVKLVQQNSATLRDITCAPDLRLLTDAGSLLVFETCPNLEAFRPDTLGNFHSLDVIEPIISVVQACPHLHTLLYKPKALVYETQISSAVVAAGLPLKTFHAQTLDIVCAFALTLTDLTVQLKMPHDTSMETWFVRCKTYEQQLVQLRALKSLRLETTLDVVCVTDAVCDRLVWVLPDSLDKLELSATVGLHNGEATEEQLLRSRCWRWPKLSAPGLKTFKGQLTPAGLQHLLSRARSTLVKLEVDHIASSSRYNLHTSPSIALETGEEKFERVKADTEVADLHAYLMFTPTHASSPLTSSSSSSASSSSSSSESSISLVSEFEIITSPVSPAVGKQPDPSDGSGGMLSIPIDIASEEKRISISQESIVAVETIVLPGEAVTPLKRLEEVFHADSAVRSTWMYTAVASLLSPPVITHWSVPNWVMDTRSLETLAPYLAHSCTSLEFCVGQQYSRDTDVALLLLFHKLAATLQSCVVKTGAGGDATPHLECVSTLLPIPETMLPHLTNLDLPVWSPTLALYLRCPKLAAVQFTKRVTAPLSDLFTHSPLLSTITLVNVTPLCNTRPERAHELVHLVDLKLEGGVIAPLTSLFSWCAHLRRLTASAVSPQTVRQARSSFALLSQRICLAHRLFPLRILQRIHITGEYSHESIRSNAMLLQKTLNVAQIIVSYTSSDYCTNLPGFTVV